MTQNDIAYTKKFEVLRDSLATRLGVLDGIRGIAILLVLWHNGILQGSWDSSGVVAKIVVLTANMGWMGVQLFFVLSGFLITGILIFGKESGLRLKNFYWNRTLRIFPLYFFSLFVVSILASYVGAPFLWGHQPASEQVWYWLYLQNWIIPFNHGAGELAHLWSLAVEEQFYLLWPLVVLFLNNKNVLRVCVFLIFSAIFARFYIVTYVDVEFSKWAAYEFTFCRWDGLAIGALLAYVVRNYDWYIWVEKSARYVLLLTAIYIVCFLMIFHNLSPVETSLSTLNQTIVAILFANLIFICLSPGSSLQKKVSVFLSAKILRNMGKYSYAIYIFHFPVILTIDTYWGKIVPFDWNNSLFAIVGRFLLFALVTYSLSRISWAIIEKPLLARKRGYDQA